MIDENIPFYTDSIIECDADEVAHGACGSGTSFGCGSGKSYQLLCCKPSLTVNVDGCNLYGGDSSVNLECFGNGSVTFTHAYCNSGTAIACSNRSHRVVLKK